MSSAEIRQAFLVFYSEKGHEIVPSSSLVPGNDPTLLFTNAGMVQFKDVFTGEEKRPYTRATSAQRCVRAGGKHNDLENVGYTARHHTFFEMLGNFSFGDYFKPDAIRFAWEFLTKVLELPEEKLWVTVHHTDKDAEALWRDDIGIDMSRFSRLGDDNFWSMGDTGPCGTSTEIFFDHGADVWGGPPGSEDEDGDRYIEIWNLVFMEFNRDAAGVQTKLPNPSIDTGLGLERVSAIMQGVHSNYEIDIFQNLLKAAAAIIGTADLEAKSLRVVADHIRSCSFLISDGVLPSNEGRGYVLRRILRRAIRHGNKLGATEVFFHKLVAALAIEMGDAYPELRTLQGQIEKVILKEEQQFVKTLDNGMRLLEQEIKKLAGSEIPGAVVFKLYDTYGFPVDLTADVARENKLSIDMPGFELEMQAQRERARASGSFNSDYNEKLDIQGTTEFSGYQDLTGSGTIIAILAEGESVASLSAGQKATIILDSTSFYAESGGQVGDSGVLSAENLSFMVDDCTKQGDLHLHQGQLLNGQLTVGQTLSTTVDVAQRLACALNHSATHLLHEALRRVVGDHVQQKGSLVDPEKLRFDFSHFEAVTEEQISEVEAIVNQQVMDNTAVITREMDITAAKALGAQALFGEKYSEQVRVVSMGTDSFSIELCGGTHVQRTGDIALLKIKSEGGIASGVRRIEAVTGLGALKLVCSIDKQLSQIASLVKGPRDMVLDKVKGLADKNRSLEKEIEQLKNQMSAAKGAQLINNAQQINGVNVLVETLQDVDPKSLRATVEQLRDKLGNAVVVLAAVAEGRVSLVAGVSKELTNKLKAGDIIRELSAKVSGKGGGRPDMAQGGGTDAAALPAALDALLADLKQL
ncbi:MAG: alanine--tRNA ligase [Pseudomonadales bacterium]|nr:alanine--tRNA ligase [Pseudomonadales bacterium]NRA16855.1 alanine--tRNA ligase [Oceanospirillaceae bacterium]